MKYLESYSNYKEDQVTGSGDIPHQLSSDEDEEERLGKWILTFEQFIHLNEGKYIGSCVDVGDSNSNREICQIFPNATSMAVKVGNPDEGDLGDSKEISKTDFSKYIKKINNRHTKGNHTYNYIAYDSLGREIPISSASVFFIYNEDDDIHYFYKK